MMNGGRLNGHVATQWKYSTRKKKSDMCCVLTRLSMMQMEMQQIYSDQTKATREYITGCLFYYEKMEE